MTFALLHLACMLEIRSVVPDALSATAQTLYGTLSLALAWAILTWSFGKQYGVVGAHGSMFMAAMCALTRPLCQSAWNVDPGSAPNIDPSCTC